MLLTRPSLSIVARICSDPGVTVYNDLEIKESLHCMYKPPQKAQIYPVDKVLLTALRLSIQKNEMRSLKLVKESIFGANEVKDVPKLLTTSFKLASLLHLQIEVCHPPNKKYEQKSSDTK